MIAEFEDEAELLERGGGSSAFNIYPEAGAGFAAHFTVQASLPTGRQSGLVE